jgi:saccharopine dehydrogenase-like NADP-dependent oxidoreductase
MKALVVGAGGKMGLAIVHAMNKLNFEVLAYDVGHLDSSIFSGDVTVITSLSEAKEVDVVISAAPFACNYEFSGWAMLREIPYCDLGGNVKISKDIQESATDSPVFTDLGLAPGWANILAEHKLLNLKEKPDKVKVMVGGLPNKQRVTQFGTLAFNWDKSFSIKGLRNEYQGMCDIVKDGKRDKIIALDGYEKLETPIGDMECFCTSGGSGSTVDFMLNHQVQNYAYKTLRWPGHHQLVSFMLNDCSMSDEDFEKHVDEAAQDPSDNIVVIKIDYIKNGKLIDGIFKAISDDDTWTAMQKTTSFPTAAIAAQMAEKRFGKKTVLKYSDVSSDWDKYKDFQRKLNQIDPSL